MRPAVRVMGAARHCTKCGLRTLESGSSVCIYCQALTKDPGLVRATRAGVLAMAAVGLVWLGAFLAVILGAP